MVKKNTGVGAKTVLEIGAGIAALSAAAYVLFGKDAKKNRKIIKAWSVKMKGEIIEKFEKAKDLTEPVYHTIVDQVQAKYAKLKDVDQEELVKTIAEIKKHWKAIKKEAQPKKKVNKKK